MTVEQNKALCRKGCCLQCLYAPLHRDVKHACVYIFYFNGCIFAIRFRIFKSFTAK